MKRFHFKEVSSTQDEAFRLRESGEEIPFFVTADRQTKGRGRQGREWHFEEGRSLALSLCLSLPSRDMVGLSLVAGLAIVEGLNDENLKLKWPNDIFFQDQKVGGILVESRSLGEKADVVIGVGLNLLPQQLSTYSSLKRTDIDPEQIAKNIEKEISLFAQTGFQPWRDRYLSRMWGIGKILPIRLQGGETKMLCLRGVNEQGFLQAQEGEEMHLNLDGEIVLQ